jgi:hypothetical protein
LRLLCEEEIAAKESVSGSMFFSEEKNQKTFASGARG